MYDKLTRFGRADIKDECRCGLTRMIAEKSLEIVLNSISNTEKCRVLSQAERDNIKPRPYASSGGINAHTSARLELAEINREIVATRSTIAEIDRVLAQLDDADAELLRAWYIEHKSKEQIADELSYSSKTSIYDLRNKAVAAFAVLYYGAGALASI